jgi:hypothetical protein
MRKFKIKGNPRLFDGRGIRLSVCSLGNSLKAGFAIHTTPLIILFVLLLAVTVNPWHSTRWGGDTGEQTYSVPPDNPDIPDEEEPPENPYLCCSSYIPIVGVVFAYGLQRWVKKNE